VTTPASDAPAPPLPSQELYKQVIHLTRANQSLTTRVARAENDSKLSAAATHKKELELADLHTKHQKVVERLHWEQAQVEEQLTSLARKLSQHCDDKDQEVQTLTAQLTAEKSAEETRRAAESDNNQVMGQLKSEITELRDMLEQSKNDVDETETRLLRAEEDNHHLNLQLKEAISAARETAKEKQRLEFAVEVIQMRCVKAEDDLLLLSEEVSAVKAIEVGV
jgi:chromosome segregation ATPase